MTLCNAYCLANVLEDPLHRVCTDPSEYSLCWMYLPGIFPQDLLRNVETLSTEHNPGGTQIHLLGLCLYLPPIPMLWLCSMSVRVV